MERMTYTTYEVADYLGLSKDMIYKMAREGEIPCARIGRRLLFKKESIDKWFSSIEEMNKIGRAHV